MEATALSVGKSVLDGALGYATSALAKEVALQLRIQKDHAFVTDELEMMQSFLMAAHDEGDNNRVVKTWVKQVRNTAYDVEDILQDFAVRLEKPSWWLFPLTLLKRRHVAKQMKELRAKVVDVSQRNARYHLVEGSGSKQAAAAAAAVEQSNQLMVAAIRREAKEKQTADLIQLISKEDDEDLKVIVVWGTSDDIGRASIIIRAAYENPDIQSEFPGRAWVRVMHPFSPAGFVQSLVNQFYAHQGAESLLETEKTSRDLAHKFNKYLNEKRCLIVLNDLSTIEEWDQIKIFFQNIRKGSQIIVSTAQVEVARLCVGQEGEASELKQVSADQTLYAFYNKGSHNGKDSAKPVPSLDEATSSTNDYKAAQREIAEDAAGTSSQDHMVVPAEIMEDKSKDDANEKKVATKSLMSIGRSGSALEESQVLGREKEISELTDLISKKDSHQGQVISVWGMAGLGKTTLVNRVYQSLKQREKFDKCVFVTIMRPFDLADTLENLVEQLHEESSKKNRGGTLDLKGSKNKASPLTVDVLTQNLRRHLNMMNCLIVLDDLSATFEWDLIRPKIPPMEKASRIIVTTRVENIAKHCSGKHGTVYTLGVLKPDDALNLLSMKVFEKATELVEKYPELTKEAEQILKRCGWLPLAIIAVGGFLAKQPKTLSEWRKLNDNISAELEMNPDFGMIRTVLEKSYDGLPYDLKSCFLYLSIFPEDCTISRRRLVRRWTAEGYSNEMRGKSAIEVADNYLKELKNRSMIFEFQQSVHSVKSIDSCKVHDLIREIAIRKSVEENLVFRLEEGCSLNNHGAVRHLSIIHWEGDQSDFETIVDISRIRSLSVFGKWKQFFISDKMRFLRVLDLEDTEGLVDHHLDRIGKLRHLKYLSLRGCNNIFVLPDSIGNLRQLQTLDIRDTFIRALPKTIVKLRKLHYIHAGQKSEYVAEERTSLRTRCQNLLDFSQDICLVCIGSSRLGADFPPINRRDACTLCCCVVPGIIMTDHLGVSVPRGMGKLKELQTLRVVDVGTGNAVVQNISKLTALRKLGVEGVNEKNKQAFCSAVSKLGRLETLSVRSYGKKGLCGCLQSISSPPEKLQSLELYGNLETLPEWIKKLQHLVKLELGSTRLPEHDAAMEFLEELPKLKILGLSGPSFKGEELRFRSQNNKSQQAGEAFGSLRVLKLAEIFNTKTLDFEKGAMPRLERLLVTGVVNNEISFSGLEFLPSIDEVHLSVYFAEDQKRIEAAHDSENQQKEQEAKHKEGELKKKIRDQLSRNRNKPILISD